MFVPLLAVPVRRDEKRCCGPSGALLQATAFHEVYCLWVHTRSPARPKTADVLLPQVVLQRPEQKLFSTVGGRGAPMNGFELILSFLETHRAPHPRRLNN